MFIELLQVAGQTAVEAAKAVATIPQSGEGSTEIVPYFTTAALIVYAQKYLKTFKLYTTFVEHFPGADKWAHRFIAAVGAVWVALGLHFTYAGSADVGYQFHLVTPAAIQMLHGLGDFLKVYVLQQVIHDGTQKDRNP